MRVESLALPTRPGGNWRLGLGPDAVAPILVGFAYFALADLGLRLAHKWTGGCPLQRSSASNAEPSLGLLEGLRSLFFGLPLFLCVRFQVTSPSKPFH